MIRWATSQSGPRHFDAVLFDLDGTLVDSSQDLTSAVNAMLGELGLPTRTRAEVLTFVGDGARDLVTRALPAERSDLVDRAFARFGELYGHRLLDATRPYPGIPAALKRLGHLKLAVASNKPERFCRRIVEGLGVAPYFKLVVGGDSLPVRKPDPAVLLAITQRLGVRPTAALLVGDGAQDIEAARRAGLTSCGVAWGYRGGEALIAAGADVVIDEPLDLLRVIDV